MFFSLFITILFLSLSFARVCCPAPGGPIYKPITNQYFTFIDQYLVKLQDLKSSCWLHDQAKPAPQSSVKFSLDIAQLRSVRATWTPARGRGVTLSRSFRWSHGLNTSLPSPSRLSLRHCSFSRSIFWYSPYSRPLSAGSCSPSHPHPCPWPWPCPDIVAGFR